MRIEIIDPNLNSTLFDKIKNRIKRFFISIVFFFKINFLIIYINIKCKNIKKFRDENFEKDLNILDNIKFINKESKMSNIFIFFVDSKSSNYLEIRKNKILKNNFNEQEILENFCNFINEKHSYHQILLFTDLKSQLSKNIKANIIRIDINSKYPMYSRNRLMKIYVNSNKFDKDTIFLDFDTILNFNANEIFKKNFDIAITYRKNDKLMPINEGVIFAKVSSKNKVIKYFNKLNSIYKYLSKDIIIKNMFDNILVWRGGQLSLSAFISWKKLNLGINNIKNIKFLVLDSDIYNFTPIRSLSLEMLNSKKILHLKGWVKGYQKKILDYL